MSDPLLSLNAIEEQLLESHSADFALLLKQLNELESELLAPELPLYNALHSHLYAMPLAGKQRWLLKTLSLTLISQLQLQLASR